jgi:hypothetical protein
MIRQYVLEEDKAEHVHEIVTFEDDVSVSVGQDVKSHGCLFRAKVPMTLGAENEPSNDNILIQPEGESTYGLSTSIASPGSDANVPTEQACRELSTADLATNLGLINALKAEIYALAIHIGVRHTADATAATTFTETIFECPIGASYTIIEAGFVPDAAFGQSTNYATLTLYNLGGVGSGTTQIAQKACSSALTVKAKNSLGTISNPTVSANEVLAITKTVTSNGQVVPSGMFYLVLHRIAP